MPTQAPPGGLTGSLADPHLRGWIATNPSYVAYQKRTGGLAPAIKAKFASHFARLDVVPKPDAGASLFILVDEDFARRPHRKSSAITLNSNQRWNDQEHKKRSHKKTKTNCDGHRNQKLSL